MGYLARQPPPRAKVYPLPLWSEDTPDGVPSIATARAALVVVAGEYDADTPLLAHGVDFPRRSRSSPVHSLLNGIVESSAAVAPVKARAAFFVSGLLQGIEPLDVVDHGSDALREFAHRFKG
jgi:hypothetical protein